MDDKRLDLDAPLLSVRRFAPDPHPHPHPKRSALPFYKSDLKTGPIRNPGSVPFVWENSPGHPKLRPHSDPPSAPAPAPKPPPGRISDEPEPESGEEREEEFCDALETLSRTESVFMNCSVSGVSAIQEPKEGGSGRFEKDMDFMMARFLPAAKAMATESTSAASPYSCLRRAAAVAVAAPAPPRVVERGGNGEERQIRFPMGYERGDANYEEEEEEEEEGYEGGNLLRGCGLLPKICLINPVVGMRVQGRSVRRAMRPGIKAVQNGAVGQAEEENSWEAVYKHKLMLGNSARQGEDVSKLTSESNHLTYQSDSPTANGSSPRYLSHSGGVSPYRNEPSQSPFQEGKGFLGVPRRDRNGSNTNGSDSFGKGSKKHWLVSSQDSSQSGSGSMSPAVERTLHIDAVHIPCIPNSMSSSIDITSDNEVIVRMVDEDSEVGVQGQRMDENLVLETNDENVTEIVDNGTTGCPESSSTEGMKENNSFQLSNVYDSLLVLERNQVTNSADTKPPLLPPPLPNSPSESWLSRALPSVSSKNPSAQSFLGMQIQPRKHMPNPSLIAPMKEPNHKPSKVRGQTRFADILAKPESPWSEI